LLIKIILGWKKLTATSTLALYDTELITALILFIVQATGLVFTKPLTIYICVGVHYYKTDQDILGLILVVKTPLPQG